MKLQPTMANTVIEIDLELVHAGQITLTFSRPPLANSVSRMLQSYLRGVALDGGERPRFSVTLSPTNPNELLLHGDTPQISEVLHNLTILDDGQRETLLVDIGKQVVQKICDALPSQASKTSFGDDVRHIIEAKSPAAASRG